MKITIIGLGLIGSSIGLKLMEDDYIEEVIGVEPNEESAKIALEMGVVDKVLPLSESYSDSDIIILATPVDVTKSILPIILETVRVPQVVMDMGSTKESIVKISENTRFNTLFVGVHPIAGTENSGPASADKDLFKGKKCYISKTKYTCGNAVSRAYSITGSLGMYDRVLMDASEHDKHIAYVSHLSHISSFALANTVLDKEESDTNILNMAGSGFESTVRLAKSNPDMWVPIIEDNKDNVLDALGDYITNLNKIKEAIEEDDIESLTTFITQANTIRKIL